MAARTIARRHLADSRIRDGCFALLFALVAWANVSGYRTTYPTLGERIAFARSFGGNASVRIFYGEPFDLLSVGGYTAWRVGGFLAILAGVWGLLAAVRALRGEEDAGRYELILAAPVGRASAYLAALAAIAVGALAMWAALLAGLVAGGLAAGPSAYLALAVIAPVPFFAGVGAVASQLAPARRIALELSVGVLAVALVTRMIADTSSGLAWLRWGTPLGWSEEMRPFTGARPLALVPSLLGGGLLLALAGAAAVRRDVGAGLLPARDRARPRLRGLSSPAALAARRERGSMAAWTAGVAFFALIVGLVSTSVSSAGISGRLQQELRRLGAVSITTPAGYISFAFLFFVLATSLFCAAQVAAARAEEAEERLETMISLPVSRHRWLGGRLLLALAGAAALAFAAALFAWLGARAEGAPVPLGRMLEAGANCLPAALLFLGVGSLAYGLVPRASAAVAYGAVVVAFVWELFGGLLGAPGWLLDLSPFRHIGFVPAQSFRAGDAAVMAAIGTAGCAAALWAFRRRDLAGR
jgi:ABC-2 type transport system permease protein